MAFIETIDPRDAEGKLAEAYARVAGERGTVASIFAIHAATPRVMLAHLELYREIQFGRSELSRREREMIAVAVSVTNHCHY
ncbi:MAG: carboxymuconolactone decarboxylase family protein [Thermoanaerobaculia bacterium]